MITDEQREMVKRLRDENKGGWPIIPCVEALKRLDWNYEAALNHLNITRYNENPALIYWRRTPQED